MSPPRKLVTTLATMYSDFYSTTKKIRVKGRGEALPDRAIIGSDSKIRRTIRLVSAARTETGRKGVPWVTEP